MKWKRLRITAFTGVATVALALGLAGCGRSAWDTIETETIAQLNYDTLLDYNLEPALESAPLKLYKVYLRPPKGFSLAKEPGRFGSLNADVNLALTKSKSEESMAILIVNPEIAKSRQPAKKTKGAAAPKEAAPKAPPIADLTKAIESVLRDQGITEDKFKNNAEKTQQQGERSHHYSFDRLSILPKDPASKGNPQFQIYIFKQKPYQVAVVFHIFQPQPLILQAKLAMETFAIGKAADDAYNGGSGGSPASSSSGGGGGF